MEIKYSIFNWVFILTYLQVSFVQNHINPPEEVYLNASLFAGYIMQQLKQSMPYVYCYYIMVRDLERNFLQFLPSIPGTWDSIIPLLIPFLKLLFESTLISIHNSTHMCTQFPLAYAVNRQPYMDTKTLIISFRLCMNFRSLCLVYVF